MSVVNRITTKVRAFIDDLSEEITEEYIVQTSASSVTITLGEENAISILDVTKNDSALGSAETYGSISSLNKVTITASLSANDVLKIKYTYYSQYSDSEIEDYIDGALSWISITGIGDYRLDQLNDKITPYISEKLENLVALITAIIVKPNYSSYRTSTVRIDYPREKSKEDKIREVIANYKMGGNLGSWGMLGE